MLVSVKVTYHADAHHNNQRYCFDVLLVRDDAINLCEPVYVGLLRKRK